jgi:hypothetical protein
MRKSLVVFAALAAGCSTMGHQRVEGWPALRIVEHRVPHPEMRDRCARYVGFGMSPEACAEFYLDRNECHIWLSADFPPQKFIVDHERLHCAGYDHTGSTNMAQALRRHQAAGVASAAAGSSSRPQ